MLADRRGSILLPGMAMGMILTMLGMHVIDTCKAILIRELGQNAADAVALESAVWHAQGMNLLVLINVVMAAILSILVAIRVAEILLIAAIAIVTIAAAVASFFSFGTAEADAAPLIEMLTNALTRTIEFENKVSPKIIDALSKAADVEKTVAAVVPYIAVAHPVTLANDVPGIPFAFSLVPAEFERQVSTSAIELKGDGFFKGYKIENAFPARMGTIALPGSMGKLVDSALAKLPAKGVVSTAVTIGKYATGSLPVQEEDFYQLCERAAELVVANMLHVFSFGGLNQSAIDKVSSFAGVIAGSLHTLACTPISELKSKVDAQVKDAVDQKCKDDKKAKEDGGGKWSDAEQKKCKDDNEKKYKKQFSAPDAEAIKVARLWGVIASPKESPFLHVYAVTQLPSKFNVEPANANGEFRHVCDGGNDAGYRGCGENSMWSNGWFAKLVPVRNLGLEVEMKLGAIFAGWLSRFMGKNVTSLVDQFVKKLPVNGNPLQSNALNDSLNRVIGTLVGPKAANGWWNRRLLGGQTFQGLQRLGVQNDLTKYPEYLH
jgi:hypothetical protein